MLKILYYIWTRKTFFLKTCIGGQKLEDMIVAETMSIDSAVSPISVPERASQNVGKGNETNNSYTSLCSNDLNTHTHRYELRKVLVWDGWLMVALMLVLVLFESIKSLSIISHFCRLLSPNWICRKKRIFTILIDMFK